MINKIESSKLQKLFNYMLLILAAFIVLFPLYIVFNMSFKSNEEYMFSGLLQFPENIFNFDNYRHVLIQGKMFTGMKNTLILVVTAVTGSILMGSMVAYALGRFDFKLKKIMIIAFMVPTVIPSVTIQIAIFIVIRNLHLFNTIYSGILLYTATDIMQILIFLQFIEKIPKSIDESARIDGASYFRIFWTIVLPQLQPAVVTVIILKTIMIYNDMLIPYLYMPKASLKTVTTALLAFSTDQNSQWNLMGAGIIFVMIPTVIMVLFLQKFIMSGITSGAVKE